MCGSSKSTKEDKQTVTATPEETAMNKLMLDQYEEIQPGQTEFYKSSYDLANTLLEGGELPGMFQGLSNGISEDIMGEQAANYVADSMPGAQSMGILDSGVIAKAMAKGVASDVMLPIKEYNSNLLMNLLGIATGQGAQATSQFSAGTTSLQQQLAGLRSTTGMSQGRNPWMTGSDLASGAGTALGMYAASRPNYDNGNKNQQTDPYNNY